MMITNAASIQQLALVYCVYVLYYKSKSCLNAKTAYVGGLLYEYSADMYENGKLEGKQGFCG